MKNQPKRKVISLITITIALIVLGVVMARSFSKNHFLWGTQIGGVSCSYMTIDSAKEKVAEKYRKQKCTLKFLTGEEYEFQLGKLGVELDDEKFVKIFNKQHDDRKSERNYSIEEVITVDETWLEVQLKRIPQLQEENMCKPKMARIEWNGIKFYVRDHVLGNEIDFREATALAKHDLERGIFQIDFSPITSTYPDIMSKDIEDKVEDLNSVVLSKMEFELSNGEVVILDNDTIRTWVTINDFGEYFIDMESGISKFVDELAAKVDEVESQLHFIPTDCAHQVVLDVPKDMRASLDKEKEIAEIKLAFEQGKRGNPQQPKLIYIGQPIATRLSDMIEVDITRQNVWMYKSGQTVLNSKFVSGDVRKGHDTPTGIFEVLSRYTNITKKCVLDGIKYSQPIKFGIRFNIYYFLNDSNRDQFGGEIYKTLGTTGGIELPEASAKTMYDNAKEGMMIIVYKS